MSLEKNQRLERYKARLDLLTKGVLAILGLVVSYVLATSKYHQEAEAKRIEYRIDFYKSVGPDLNTLYSFACRVGNYSFTSPHAAGAIKRKTDTAFVINLPLMSLETFDSYPP